MELSKHNNHRNLKYLSWLRSKKCVVSGDNAEVAHHIRLGTNGGKGLKPSDYFCFPLLEEYHTHGSMAVHRIGEDSFLTHFKLEKEPLFAYYLQNYLKEVHGRVVKNENLNTLEFINVLISTIEEVDSAHKNRSKKSPGTRKKKSSQQIARPSVTENEYYQKAKELKRIKDKELRDHISKSTPKKRMTLNKGEFYEKAKELKRQRDRELRELVKASKKQDQGSPVGLNPAQTQYQEQAKEARKKLEKDIRDKNKKRLSEYRKEQYQKAKKRRKEWENSQA